MIDQVLALLHQRLAGTQKTQCALVPFTDMAYTEEQPAVKTSQPGQHLGITPIRLVAALLNRPQLARIRHDYLSAHHTVITYPWEAP
jgi:hypothetical protein